MIDLKEWIDRNAQRPLVGAIGAVLCLQIGYLAYLAHDEYATQLRRIDRVVETASLGMQQDNRTLVESVLITGLNNADADSVALCRNAKATLIYPPTSADPCRPSRGGVSRWTARRGAVGLAGYEFVFVIDPARTFLPSAVWLAITALLSLALFRILVRARRKFRSEVLDPLQQGLNADAPLMIFELDELRRRNQRHIALSRRQAVTEALFEMSTQVAHDIRSPLAALEVACADAAQLAEDKRTLIRSAVGRIRDIANSLMNKNRAMTARGGELSAAGPAGASPQLLSSLIEPLVTEKRLQFRAQPRVEIEAALGAASYGIFARVEPVEFKRLLSNLVNNAVEAFADASGSVRVGLSARDGRALVSVRDDGKGIPPEVLVRIGKRGETHGKTGGSGLGLHHAWTSAEAWGGRLDVASEEGRGATVTLDLPLAPTPAWFVSELTLLQGRAVMVLDDDASIHHIWQGRLDAAGAVRNGIELVHASTPQEVARWIDGNAEKAREALYLLDYELLGHEETGLSLADRLGISARAILVTSRYEEPQVLETCLRLGVRLIPKGLAGLVPIRVGAVAETEPASTHLDAVLIDDDALARMTWKVSAERSGRVVRSFERVEDFLASASGIDRCTPLYIDANLGDGISGAEESKRIHALGFSEIYLATGHPAEMFSGCTHLRGVVGKDPPWEAAGNSELD